MISFGEAIRRTPRVATIDQRWTAPLGRKLNDQRILKQCCCRFREMGSKTTLKASYVKRLPTVGWLSSLPQILPLCVPELAEIDRKTRVRLGIPASELIHHTSTSHQYHLQDGRCPCSRVLRRFSIFHLRRMNQQDQVT